MAGWGSDDDEEDAGQGKTPATATTPLSTTVNTDSWANDDASNDIQAQPMSANSFPQPSEQRSFTDRLEMFLSKAIIRVFLLPPASYCPAEYQSADFFKKDKQIAGIGRDINGDYYFLHRNGMRMFDKPWAKTWTPVSEEAINNWKRIQSAVYLTTDGPTHYYEDLRDFLKSRRIVSESGNLYVPTSQGLQDYPRIQIELDDNLEIAKQCTNCLKWETEWEMQSDGSKKRLEMKDELVRFLPCRGCKKQVYCSKECHQVGWESHHHKFNCSSTLFGDWSSECTYWDQAPIFSRPISNGRTGADSAWGGTAAQERRAQTPGGEQTMDWEAAGGSTANAATSALAPDGAWGGDTPAPALAQAQNGTGAQENGDAWSSSPLPLASGSGSGPPAVTTGVPSSDPIPGLSAPGTAISASIPAAAVADNAWGSPTPASGTGEEVRNSAAWGGDTPMISSAGAPTTNHMESARGGDTPMEASSGLNSVAAASAWDNDAPSASTTAAAPASSAWGSGSSPPHTSAPTSSTPGWGDASGNAEASNAGGWGSSEAGSSFRGGRGGFRGGEGRGRGGFRGDFRGGGRGRSRGGDFVPRGTSDSGWGGFRGRGRGRGRGSDSGQSFNGGHRGGWGGQNTYNYNNNTSSFGNSDNDSWSAPPTSTATQANSDEWGSSSSAPTSIDSTANVPVADTWASKVDEGVGLNGSKTTDSV